jgi:2-polyprenyl-3-methyl-5-hydroxy-6-metoxy-1,4-benzoquinol methylase
MIEQNVRGGDFNGLAANYERYRIGYSSELLDGLESLGLRRGANVLDAGCGTGISIEPLLARGMTVTGLDPSAQMLAVARTAVPAAKYGSPAAIVPVRYTQFLYVGTTAGR